MKARNVFALLGLTFAMGAGVFAGVASKRAEEVGAVDAGTSIYLDVSGGDWFEASAKVAIWNHQGNCFEEFTADVDSGLYKVDLSQACTSFNLFRGSALNWDNKWNQSDNASFDGAKNLIKSTGYNDGKMTFYWDTYVPPVEPADPSLETNSFYLYDEAKVFGNDVTKINVYGFDPLHVVKDMDWPGQNDVTSATLGGVTMYSFVLSVSYPSVIINNGNGNNQTIDINDVNDHIGDVLRIGSETGEAKHYAASWQEASDFTDRPEHDGYYLVGSETSWQIASAPELGAGDDLNHAKLLRYDAVADEEFKVVHYSNYTKIWHSAADGNEDGNYVVKDAGLINVFLSKGDGLVYVEQHVPASDGYYLYGSVIGWEDYDSTYKMTNTSQGGNLAFFMDYEAEVNELLRVRSYYTDRYPYESDAICGNSVEDYGTRVEDNFKFTKAGHYDIYAKMEEEVFKFYVAEHVVSYTFERTAVKFTGATKTGTESLENETAYSGDVYNPTKTPISGYVARDVYTDENCTTPYTPAEPEANGHVYIKYTKVGFYTISEAGAWSIDNAVEMNTSGINPSNDAETVVVVSAANECYSFVYYDGSMAGQDGLGGTYTFAIYEGDHVKFTKAGTYAVYLGKDHLVYLNEGKVAFFTNFLSETGGVCKTDDSTDLEALGAIWEAQANVYKTLPKDDKDYIVDTIGFDGGDEKSEDLGKQFMARYHYIVTKYGTAAFNDFIFNQNIEVSRGVLDNPTSSNVDNTALIAIISAITIVSVSSIAVLLVIKKRKHN